MSIKKTLLPCSRALFQLVFLVALFAGANAAAAAGPLCDGGQVIWDNGNNVGCIFNSWGPSQASQCNGATVLPLSPGGTCWVCVTSPYVSVVGDPNQWSSLAIGTTWANSQPADFSCQEPDCQEPIYISDGLTSNRYNALPNDTLQATMFYDGSQPQDVELRLQYIDAQGDVCWMTIDDIDVFTNAVSTREYDLNGADLTGNVEITGVTGNGGIDGLAFGLYFKEANGRYYILKSNQASPAYGHDFVGAWPIAMSWTTFTNRTPQITDGHARHQARASINGAALLPNGPFNFTIY